MHVWQSYEEKNSGRTSAGSLACTGRGYVGHLPWPVWYILLSPAGCCMHWCKEITIYILSPAGSCMHWCKEIIIYIIYCYSVPQRERASVSSSHAWAPHHSHNTIPKHARINWRIQCEISVGQSGSHSPCTTVINIYIYIYHKK
jgi:hypothetical protein